MPLTMRDASALVTIAIGVTAAPPPTTSAAREPERAAGCLGVDAVSTSVFQEPHDGHWPAHFGEPAPHCWQR
jgi:hypothetical protein